MAKRGVRDTRKMPCMADEDDPRLTLSRYGDSRPGPAGA
jgi:hypothetical protein